MRLWRWWVGDGGVAIGDRGVELSMPRGGARNVRRLSLPVCKAVRYGVVCGVGVQGSARCCGLRAFVSGIEKHSRYLA